MPLGEQAAFDSSPGALGHHPRMFGRIVRGERVDEVQALAVMVGVAAERHQPESAQRGAEHERVARP